MTALAVTAGAMGHGNGGSGQMGHSGGDQHGQTTRARLGTRVVIRVKKDRFNGWNLLIGTRRFRFAPENASEAHRSGEGHAHLEIDGKPITRIYSRGSLSRSSRRAATRSGLPWPPTTTRSTSATGVRWPTRRRCVSGSRTRVLPKVPFPLSRDRGPGRDWEIGVFERAQEEQVARLSLPALGAIRWFSGLVSAA